MDLGHIINEKEKMEETFEKNKKLSQLSSSI